MFDKVKEIIEKSNNILILTHQNPDGDALGSAVGFKYLLKEMGKNGVILLEKELPSMFRIFGDEFLWGECDFPYDLAVSLDCGDIGRLGEVGCYLTGNTLNIDHHISNTGFAMVNYVDSKASATGEIICKLADYLGVSYTEKMASALYGAILTDTGGFMFSNTGSETHKIAAKLIEAGADYYNYNKKLIQEKDYKRQLVGAKCVEKMEFYADGRICVCVLNNGYCTDAGIIDEDLNGIAQIPRTVSGVEVGCLITEINKGLVKVSLRSDCIVDVSQIAEKFGGGGHMRASGIKIRDKSIEKVKEELILEIEKQLEVEK